MRDMVCQDPQDKRLNDLDVSSNDNFMGAQPKKQHAYIYILYRSFLGEERLGWVIELPLN